MDVLDVIEQLAEPSRAPARAHQIVLSEDQMAFRSA